MMDPGTSNRRKSGSGNTGRQEVTGQESLVTISNTLPYNMYLVEGRQKRIVLERNGICLS